MAMSTFQKVTLATCLLLCVALLLPKMLLSRGRRDAAERPEGSGHLPPMMHRQDGRGQRAAAAGFSRAHNSEATARTKAAGTGAGTGGKSNLAGQIIPVYGFGILLYILYILFKITSKGNSKPSESSFPSLRSENMKRKITDFELAQLQERLRETELVMENIVSNAHHSPDSVKGVTADQEDTLLQQLTEITRVMQEGQLAEHIAPEKKSQDDWEELSADPPEETEPYWERSHCRCHHHPQTQTADQENPPEDVTGGGETEEGEGLDADADCTAVSGDDVTPEGRLGTTEMVHGHEEDEGHIDLGVPEEELAGVLEELELSLRMSSVMEQEKVEDLTRLTERDAAGCSVRRRNRRRRAKKASH